MSYLVVNRKPNESLILTVNNPDGTTTKIEVDVLPNNRVGVRAPESVAIVRNELVNLFDTNHTMSF
jgi:sRNA-binding carbon storage regulator CsrA